MFRRILGIALFTTFAALLCAMVARPILQYEGVKQTWMAVDTDASIGLVIIIIASGGAAFLFGSRENWRKFRQRSEAAKLPKPVENKIVAAGAIGLMAGVVAIEAFIADPRTKDLAQGLFPYGFGVVFMAFYVGYSRAARRKTKPRNSA